MDLRVDESWSSFVFLPCWLRRFHNTPYISSLGMTFTTLTEVKFESCR